ncbi:hypothetical protein KEM48_001445 [Puccinia striiformis f. sp. tritici PST-130]|nr:hypothetical protein KEM48_001445 [Puccinia striiformis f. sp. tritici PST-130]
MAMTSDPEAIIRAANAARRHLTQLIRSTQPSSMTDSPGNTTSIPHLADDTAEANALWIRRLEDLLSSFDATATASIDNIDLARFVILGLP